MELEWDIIKENLLLHGEGSAMELTQLKQFCVVAQTENLVDASNILEISQPALTKSIRRLENELGTSLFDRSNHKLMLNAAGKEAMQYTNEILSDLEDMANDLKYAREEDTVRIVSSFMSIQMFLSAALRASFPKQEFYYQTRKESRFEEYLKEELFDIAISSQKITDPEIECRILLTDWQMISVPQSSSLYGKKMLRLEDLNGAYFMSSIDMADLPAPFVLFNLLHKRNIPVHIVTMANSLSVVSLAAYNDYLFCASSLGSKALDYSPHRRFVPIDPNDNVCMNFYVSYLKKNSCHLSPYVTWFEQKCNEEILPRP